MILFPKSIPEVLLVTVVILVASLAIVEQDHVPRPLVPVVGAGPVGPVRRGEGDVLEDVLEVGLGQTVCIGVIVRVIVHVERQVVLVAQLVLETNEVDIGGHDVAQSARHARE